MTIGASSKHTIPCAVCFVPARPTVLMIPGKARCPPTWTREYFGYLMSEATKWERGGRSTYECVDKDQQSLPLSPNWGSTLYPIEADCSSCKASCPPTWTREYFGYLMSEATKWARGGRSMYECVDKDQQSLPLSPNWGSTLYHIEADCSSGLPCPPDTNYKEINCVVCTT